MFYKTGILSKTMREPGLVQPRNKIVYYRTAIPYENREKKPKFNVRDKSKRVCRTNVSHR